MMEKLNKLGLLTEKVF